MSNPKTEHIAYIALGSNMGDRDNLLIQALSELEQHDQITIEQISSIYETDPVGYTDQDAFLNMVVRVRTSLYAEQLLDTQLLKLRCIYSVQAH